jgi:hypothetical protein
MRRERVWQHPSTSATSQVLGTQRFRSTHRLYFWKRRLEQSGKDSNPPVAFVELRRSAPAAVEVVLRSGRVLRVSESIDSGALRRLVDVLEQERAC